MDYESDGFSDEEVSDYIYSSDYNSDSDDFYNGYSEKPIRRGMNNYISMSQLKSEYRRSMEYEKKNLLFFNAVEENDFDFLERLILDGVEIDCIGRDGWTPLMKACLNGQDLAVRFLLEHGSNPHFEADSYSTLMASCTSNPTEEEFKLACVELLLEHNVDVNVTDRHKTNALMHASSAGYLSIVDRLFLVEDLNADTQDFEGWNAVFHAVANNHYPVVEALINYGVNYKVRDNYGRTAMALAEEKCLSKIVDLLIEYEENEDVPSDEGHEDEKCERESNYCTSLLKELPNADGEGGFTSDTQDILSAYGFDNISNIPFQDFLKMNEDELLAMGVKIKAQRKQLLLKVIHRYHRCPWFKSSLNPLMLETPLGLEESICILGNVAKHLTLAKASLQYLKYRIESRKITPNTSLQRDSIESCVSVFESCTIIRKKLENLLELANDVIPVEIDDLIVADDEEESNKMSTSFKYGLMILGATTAGYFVFNCRLKIGCFINEFMFFRK